MSVYQDYATDNKIINTISAKIIKINKTKHVPKLNPLKTP